MENTRHFASERKDGYHPQYWIVVWEVQRSVIRRLIFWGVVLLPLIWGFCVDWGPNSNGGKLSDAFMTVASVVGAIFVLCLISVPASLRDIRQVSILPYFKKGEVIVDGETFLHGKALARNWLFVEEAAQRNGLQSLSRFGFADDMAGETVVWHEASEGLAAVNALLALLRRNPDLIEESAAVIEDLVRIAFRLEDAMHLRVPFCLLQRFGNTASGYEMDMRQGYLLG